MPRGIAGRVGGCLAIAAVVVVATGMATAARAVPGAAAQQATVVRGAWHKGQLVPGVAALNAGGNAAVTAISCTGPGDCTAGGYYTPANAPASTNARRAWVDSEVTGHWGTARQVPGTGSGGAAAVTTVACTSPGNCVAGGYDGTMTISVLVPSLGFTVTEVNGHWGTAHHLSTGKASEETVVTSVSCSAAGECLAGGYSLYLKQVDVVHYYFFGYAFGADERHGIWGAPRQLSGESVLYSTPTSVSCASPGNCAAGAGATPAPVIAQEESGTWHSTALPGFPATFYAYGNPVIVACPRAGDCTAGGTYQAAGLVGVWVASESGYRWGRAVELSLGVRGISGTTVNAISCTAPGYCTLAGQVRSGTTTSATARGFTATEAGGRWSSARLVVSGASGNVPSVSCPALGYCVAAVGNTNYAPHVIEEAGGTWGTPLVLPNLTHPGLISSVSCARPGWCAAGGSYSLLGRHQAIVADETVPTAG